MRKVLGVLVIGLLLSYAASAQTKATLSFMPEKVMNAELQSLDGSQPIRLSAYRGRVTVLVLWASWCPPCGMAIETLNGINAGSPFNGVNVVGLSTEDPNSEADKARYFVRINKVAFKLGWINEDMQKVLDVQDSIPQIFVINGDGLIVKRFIGWHPDKTPKLLRKTVRQARQNPLVMQ